LSDQHRVKMIQEELTALFIFLVFLVVEHAKQGRVSHQS
jgi:hypothetical protein